MAEPSVVIIIPSQGNDLNGFEATAQALAHKVYGGRATIVKTTVAKLDATYDVKFRALAGKDFTFADKKGLSRVITVSHSWTADGPNLANGAGGHQPWGTLGNEGNELTAQGKAFWREVGAAMDRAGQIILLGCMMGKGNYARLVAHAAERPVYAAADIFAAGNSETAVKYVTEIEAGRTPAPMRKFGPYQPMPK